MEHRAIVRPETTEWPFEVHQAQHRVLGRGYRVRPGTTGTRVRFRPLVETMCNAFQKGLGRQREREEARAASATSGGDLSGHGTVE